jgi:hypothetical protein
MFKTYKRKTNELKAIEITQENMQTVVDFLNERFKNYKFEMAQVFDSDKTKTVKNCIKFEQKPIFKESFSNKYVVFIGDFIAHHGETDVYPIEAENFEKIYGPALEIPEGLPEHMQRVYVELHDLDKKIHDLGVYIANGQPKASPQEAQLQLSQFESMKKYSSILNERIKLYIKN